VNDVMRVAVTHIASGKAASAVAVLERPPDCRRHRARATADAQGIAMLIARHDNPPGIARQPA
jgi:hypothetical protein